MGKGGYQFIDLTIYGNITASQKAEEGLYDIIEGATCPIMLSTCVVDDIDNPSQFVVPTFTANEVNFVLKSGGQVIITDEDMIRGYK